MFSKQRRYKALAAGFCAVALTVTGTSVAEAHSRTAVPYQAAQSEGAEYEEWLILQMINKERSNAGLNRVAFEYNIHQYARFHADKMKDEGRLWHDMNRYRRSVPRGATLWGENTAYNYTVDAAHVTLMNSDGHRANILNPNFTHVGIGVRRNAEGQVFISENFADLR